MAARASLSVWVVAFRGLSRSSAALSAVDEAWRARRKTHVLHLGFRTNDNSRLEFFEHEVDKLGLLQFFNTRPSSWRRPGKKVPKSVSNLLSEKHRSALDYEKLLDFMMEWFLALEDVRRLDDVHLVKNIFLQLSSVELEPFAPFWAEGKREEEVRDLRNRSHATLTEIVDQSEFQALYSDTEDVISLALLFIKLFAPWPEWLLLKFQEMNLRKLRKDEFLTVAWMFRLRKAAPEAVFDNFEDELFSRIQRQELSDAEMASAVEMFNMSNVAIKSQAMRQHFREQTLQILGQLQRSQNKDAIQEFRILASLLWCLARGWKSDKRSAMTLSQQFVQLCLKRPDAIPMDVLTASCVFFIRQRVFWPPLGQAALAQMSAQLAVAVEEGRPGGFGLLGEVAAESAFHLPEDVVRAVEGLLLGVLRDDDAHETHARNSALKLAQLSTRLGLEPSHEMLGFLFDPGAGRALADAVLYAWERELGKLDALLRLTFPDFAGPLLDPQRHRHYLDSLNETDYGVKFQSLFGRPAGKFSQFKDDIFDEANEIFGASNIVLNPLPCTLKFVGVSL